MSSKIPIVLVIWISLAGLTSCDWGDSSVSAEPGNVTIASDCSDSQTSGESELIRSEGHRGYVLLEATEYGFPSNNLIFIEEHRLTSTDEASRCNAYLFSQNERKLIFLCHEGTQLKCSIVLERI